MLDKDNFHYNKFYSYKMSATERRNHKLHNNMQYKCCDPASSAGQAPGMMLNRSSLAGNPKK